MRRPLISFVILCMSLGAVAQRLWRVEPAGGMVPPSYILGTHHLAGAATMPPRADSLLAASRVVAGEVVLSSFGNPDDAMLMVAPADSSLNDLLSPVQLDSVVRVLQAYGCETLPPGAIAVMRPVVVGSLLVQCVSPRHDGELLDGYVQTRALALGIPVEGLETPREQLLALVSRPVAEEVAELMELVRDIDTVADDAARLMDAYLAGDIDTLQRMVSAGVASPSSASLTDRLLVERNRRWMPSLRRLVEAGGAFVAVGAAHLPGDEGLLQLLAADGFKVTPAE